jgi:hypothetical protein
MPLERSGSSEKAGLKEAASDWSPAGNQAQRYKQRRFLDHGCVVQHGNPETLVDHQP